MTTRVVRALVCAAATLFSMSACEVDKASSVELADQALAAAGAGGSAKSCVPVDTKDTVPDRIDEDCDGRIDEDVDATRANCPAGTRIIEGTRKNDVLRGTSGRDCILGYGGNDTIYGMNGDDVIFAGPGDDRVYPGGGNALVHAGSGDDLVDASLGCGSTVYGEAGRDTLIGGPGPDVFYGGDDNDVLKGGGGADTLSGGGCNDWLVGGQGRDAANGGADSDACDAESVSECEKTEASKLCCSSDADCRSGDSCAANVNFCVPRSAANCGSCRSTAATDVTCDGVDDDCDGQIDDDYVTTPITCGSGSCAANGVKQCVNGHEQSSCAPGLPLPGNDATCDGKDDDCDGRVDEGFVPSTRSCGVGVCQSTGGVSCEAGVIVDTCQPGGPTAVLDTTCDGLDDDCDGLVDDEAVPAASHCGTGVCARTGVATCIGGQTVDSCVAGAPSAETDTTCDGLDDDCDGQVDEEVAPPAETHCGDGVCARTGIAACSGGQLVDSCVPGEPTAVIDTSCNGLDDDCNGRVDDAYVSTPTTCGTGICARTGATSCVAGQVVDSCVVTCEGGCNDGIDDDKDGLLDCLDNDCRNAVGCLQGSFGAPCTTNSQCDRVGPEPFCITGVPAGYCTRPCSTGCPAGTHCLVGGTSCVVDCGPGNHCGRPDYVCTPVGFPGSETDAFCHGNCALSCPSDTQCNPATFRCDPIGS